MTDRGGPFGVLPTDSAGPERHRAVYCPLCQEKSPRDECIRLWRHVRSASTNGRPVEVLKHRRCKEMVYVVLL
jgi:hypothetical protein